VVLEALTPEEQRRHEKAIAKLRAELFRHHSPAHYFIVPGSEVVLGASAEMRWDCDRGRYRVLHLGGIKFLIDCADPHGHTTLTIRHKEKAQFYFWLTAAEGYTLTAATAEFKQLATSIRASIKVHLVENWWSVYAQRYQLPNG
jgi:hypothetical protein